MAKQILNVGVTNNDKSGDTLRAGGLKIRSNFDEIYAALATDGLNISGGNLLKTGSWNDVRNKPNFANIATSGSYDDLTDKPDIVTATASPETLVGFEGQQAGQIAFDGNNLYVSTVDYDGETQMWKYIPWGGSGTTQGYRYSHNQNPIATGGFSLDNDNPALATVAYVATTDISNNDIHAFYQYVVDNSLNANLEIISATNPQNRALFHITGITELIASDVEYYELQLTHIMNTADMTIDSGVWDLHFDFTGAPAQEQATISKYVAVNSDGVISGSDDGVTWNEYTSNLSSINRVAVGPNKIVYIANSSSGHGNTESLWYASVYNSEPTEVTSLTTRDYYEVKYFKSISKFIAVGDNGDGVPTLHYSDDGETWVESSVDPTFLQTIEGFNGASFTDIAENGSGFLVISSNKTLGGFFLSNITDTMDGSNHVDLSSLPSDPDEVVWANSYYFTGWHLFTDNNEWCYNNENNPTAGSFQTDFITLDSAWWQDQIGIQGGDLVEFVVGEYAGMSVIMISTNDGQTVYWPTVPAGPYVSIPKPYTATITGWTSSATSTITYTALTGSGGLGEKFTVTGSTVAGYNGTYYLGTGGGVFTDKDLTIAFDTTGLDPFTGTATIAWSKGQYIDALHYNDGVFYAGNDNEEMFKSTNGGQSWTKVDQLGGGQGEGDGYLNDIDSYISDAVSELTFNGVQIRGKAKDGKYGLIKLVPNTSIEGHSFLDNGQYVDIYPTLAFDAPHIHIAAGTGASGQGDIFLGDDNKYVQVNHDGTVSIQSFNTDSFNTHNWSFKPDGSMQFPWIETNIHNGGNQYAQTLKFGNPGQQVIITGPTPETNTSAERIIIQGQRGLGTGEGGDVYLWGGDAEGTNGGDIKIYAGDADQNDAGYGGYVYIDGGRGFNGGGNVEITGGSSPGGNGGNVTIRSGNGSNDTTNGAVFIETTNNVWSFDRTGVLTLPVNGDIVNSNGTSVLGGGGASTGDFTFTNAEVSVTDNASLTVTGNTIFTATIPSSGGMAWSGDNSFLGTYTSGSIGYSDFSQFDGQKVIFFDNVMSTNLSTQLNAMAIGDTILVEETPPYTVTLTSTFSSSMGRFIASVTTPESNRTVTNQLVITRTVLDTNEFHFKGNGELVAPKVVAATSLVIPSYTINECGFGRNTVAGTNGAIISVSDSDQDVSNPNVTAGYYPPNMLAYWVPTFNQNPPPGQEAGAWVYLHQNGSSYYLVGN